MTTGSPTKQALREASRASRRSRSEADQERLSQGFRAQLLARPERAAAARGAAFLSQDGEPGTHPTIEAVSAGGVEVILPVLLPSFDLDWGRYAPGEQRPGRFGLLVPTTPALGLEAVSTAAVVICPGVAVDRDGRRLGRGGGSYDRALARCGPGVLRVQLVYDDEVVDVVPTEPHDQPVDVIVTPAETIRVSRRARA